MVASLGLEGTLLRVRLPVKILIVAVLLVTTASCSLPTGTSSGGPPVSEDVVSTAAESLLGCAPDPQQAFTQSTERCVSANLDLVARDHGALAADAALARALEKAPHLEYVCHGAAHRAGALSYDGEQAAVEALRGLRSGTCQSGVLHGVLDASADGMEENMFTRLAAVCEGTPRADAAAQEIALEEAGRCADGLGHVAAVAGVPAWCARFQNEQVRENCASGIVMGVYQPVTAAEPLPGVSWQDVAALCASWPLDAGPQGCAAGAAYAFSREFATRGVLLPAQENPAREAHALVGKYLHAHESGCGLLPKEQRRHCQEVLLEHVPDPMARASFAELCPQLPAWLAGRCRERAPAA